MCGTSPTWQKSRALLGSLNNIPRSRVQDLVNPDVDHPLAPHWRVPFCESNGSHLTCYIVHNSTVCCSPRHMIQMLLPTTGGPAKGHQGHDPNHSRPSRRRADRAKAARTGRGPFAKQAEVGKPSFAKNCEPYQTVSRFELVVPLSNQKCLGKIVRFGEWSKACWNLQKRLLNDDELMDNHPDVRFAAIYHSDQAADHKSFQETVTGLVMSEHWDVSDQAGSKSRGRAVFGEPLPTLESLAVVDGELKIPGECLSIECLVFLRLCGHQNL